MLNNCINAPNNFLNCSANPKQQLRFADIPNTCPYNNYVNRNFDVLGGQCPGSFCNTHYSPVVATINAGSDFSIIEDEVVRKSLPGGVSMRMVSIEEIRD